MMGIENIEWNQPKNGLKQNIQDTLFQKKVK